MFGLVIFDLDGTLVDTVPEIAAAANAALTELGLKPVDEGLIRSWIGNGSKETMMRAYRHAAGIAEHDVDDGCRQSLRLFNWFYGTMSGRSGSTLFPDVEYGLSALRDLGISTALVTNKESRFTSPLLHAHGLWPYLDAVVCGDALERKKPDPLPIQHCLKRLQTHPSQALMVGDSEIDVAAARDAGVAVWTVPYGYHGGKLIGKATPDRVIPTIRVIADTIA